MESGSSGKIRTYNPPVNSPSLRASARVFSTTYREPKVRFGAHSAPIAVKFAVKFPSAYHSTADAIPEGATRLVGMVPNPGPVAEKRKR
jgi:hypothetical protein